MNRRLLSSIILPLGLLVTAPACDQSTSTSSETSNVTASETAPEELVPPSRRAAAGDVRRSPRQ